MQLITGKLRGWWFEVTAQWPQTPPPPISPTFIITRGWWNLPVHKINQILDWFITGTFCTRNPFHLQDDLQLSNSLANNAHACTYFLWWRHNSGISSPALHVPTALSTNASVEVRSDTPPPAPKQLKPNELSLFINGNKYTWINHTRTQYTLVVAHSYMLQD